VTDAIDDSPDAVWSPFTKSTFSGGGGCVEVSISSGGDVRLRDSKWADSPVLAFNPVEWAAFLKGVRAGEFELP
jgi:hypothetical protein